MWNPISGMHHSCLLAIGLVAVSALAIAVPGWADEDTALFNTYTPSEANPFGQLNLEAPAAAADYAFMVGEWQCEEHARQGEEWVSYPSGMRAQFYLNGYGVVNFTWTPTGASSMSYMYDDTAEEWVITNTSSPAPSHTVWRGAREGDARQASLDTTGPDGQPVTLRITFDNISDDGFDWRMEAMPPSGPYLLRNKTCTRI